MVKMTRIGLRKWTVTTRDVNYEYGFALGNEAGEILREIGPWVTTKQHGPKSGGESMDACTVTFWPYRNRLIPQKPNAAPGPLNVTACFASCTKTCELRTLPTPLASLDRHNIRAATRGATHKFRATSDRRPRITRR